MAVAFVYSSPVLDSGTAGKFAVQLDIAPMVEYYFAQKCLNAEDVIKTIRAIDQFLNQV